MPETYTRKPNCECAICGTQMYRRLKRSKSGQFYCSKQCYGKSCQICKPCVICGTLILSGKHAITCSRSCSNKHRAGMHYNVTKYIYKPTNSSEARLLLLQQTFNFTSCMVEGCEYNRTYDVHRHIPGKEGGKYEIGNMFAICPNHHAEVSRGLIRFEIVRDDLLRILSGE